MSRVRTIFKSMSWLFASNIVGFICGFIWTILIARYLQVSEYGILGFATSLSGILAFTTDWGITTYIVRHVSTNRSTVNKYLNNSIPLKTIFSATTLILTLVLLLMMGEDETTVTVTVIVTPYMVLKSFMWFFKSIFQTFENRKLIDHFISKYYFSFAYIGKTTLENLD